MSVKVSFTGNNLEALANEAAQKATQIVMAELNAAFQESFDAKAWDWPRDLPTRKLNGATLAEKIESYSKGEGIKAGNPRNLIDEGNLRREQSWQMSGAYQAKFIWSSQYATAVHEGARIYPWGNRKAARVQLPARPWTSAVLGRIRVPAIEPFPFAERLRDVWIAYFKSRT